MDLKSIFEKETGVSCKNSQGELGIDYVNWLEKKVSELELGKKSPTLGNKNDLPPKGYVRITGAENKSDWNELVKIEDIEKRSKEIFSEYPDEDAWYTDLKFFWVRYEDGGEKQMADIAWK